MRRLVALLTIVVGLAVTSGTASAGGGLLSGLLGGGCGVTAPVFLPWGDYSGYYFAPNGGFESGSSNWTLSGGAAVVTQDNEPWYLAGFGLHALSIPTGGSASTSVCFGAHLSRRAVLRGRRRRRRDDSRPGRVAQPPRRSLRPRRRHVHGGLGVAPVTQAFHAVQRARRAARLEDDDAPVHCRARHGTDRRPLRRSVPDEGLGEEERASAVRSAGGAAQRLGLRAARRGAAGARSARVLRRRRRR